MATKKRKIIAENFKSLTQFIDIAEERPQNAVFKEKEVPSSQRDETKQKQPQSGTKTYEEATKIMLAGYREPLDRMKKAILKIGQQDNHQRPRPRNDFVGFAPHVPNAIMGLPMTMINRDNIAPKTKTIHLTYSFCGAAMTTPKELEQGGINFISLVNSLEKQGYRVKIDLLFASLTDKTAACFTINLKEYGQQTNLLKLAFPLVHTAMLRRFSFKWLETTPDLKDNAFYFGYGTPLPFAIRDGNKQKEFLTENKLLKGEKNYYCDVYQAINAQSVEDLAEALEIIK